MLDRVRATSRALAHDAGATECLVDVGEVFPA